MGIKGYKAFGKGLICNPDGVAKQYKEHTTFEEDGDVNLGPCRKGVMHFCEDPFDILGRYPLFNSDGEITEIAEVEAVGDVRNFWDQSITNKLHIGAKLNFKGFVKACVDFTIEKTKFEIDKDSDSDINSGNYAQIGSSGDSAKITSVEIPQRSHQKVRTPWLWRQVLTRWQKQKLEVGLLLPNG